MYETKTEKHTSIKGSVVLLAFIVLLPAIAWFVSGAVFSVIIAVYVTTGVCALGIGAYLKGRGSGCRDAAELIKEGAILAQPAAQLDSRALAMATKAIVEGVRLGKQNTGSGGEEIAGEWETVLPPLQQIGLEEEPLMITSEEEVH